jgi:hypothetical protein
VTGFEECSRCSEAFQWTRELNSTQKRELTSIPDSLVKSVQGPRSRSKLAALPQAQDLVFSKPKERSSRSRAKSDQ